MLGLMVAFSPFLTNLTTANDPLRLPDVRSIGMGENGVTESLAFNPALAGISTRRDACFQYFNRYGLKELGTFTGILSYSNEILPAGLHVASFGYDVYREYMIRLFVGKRLSEQWALGISFQYTALSTELFDERPAAFSTDLGIVYIPVEELLITAVVINTPSVEVGDKTGDSLSFGVRSFLTGFRWRMINNLLITAFARYDDVDRAGGGIGVEYTPYERFHIRAGVKGKPFLPTLGTGFTLSHFSFDVAASYHSVLGISSGVGFTFSF